MYVYNVIFSWQSGNNQPRPPVRGCLLSEGGSGGRPLLPPPSLLANLDSPTLRYIQEIFKSSQYHDNVYKT